MQGKAVGLGGRTEAPLWTGVSQHCPEQGSTLLPLEVCKETRHLGSGWEATEKPVTCGLCV